jgi:L-asparagine transporter-like permease
MSQQIQVISKYGFASVGLSFFILLLGIIMTFAAPMLVFYFTLSTSILMNFISILLIDMKFKLKNIKAKSKASKALTNPGTDIPITNRSMSTDEYSSRTNTLQLDQKSCG